MVKSLGEKRHYAGHACEGKVDCSALGCGVRLPLRRRDFKQPRLRGDPASFDSHCWRFLRRNNALTTARTTSRCSSFSAWKSRHSFGSCD